MNKLTSIFKGEFKEPMSYWPVPQNKDIQKPQVQYSDLVDQNYLPLKKDQQDAMEFTNSDIQIHDDPFYDSNLMG